jgi:hypothetical protein
MPSGLVGGLRSRAAVGRKAHTGRDGREKRWGKSKGGGAVCLFLLGCGLVAETSCPVFHSSPRLVPSNPSLKPQDFPPLSLLCAVLHHPQLHLASQVSSLSLPYSLPLFLHLHLHLHLRIRFPVSSFLEVFSPLVRLSCAADFLRSWRQVVDVFSQRHHFSASRLRCSHNNPPTHVYHDFCFRCPSQRWRRILSLRVGCQ